MATFTRTDLGLSGRGGTQSVGFSILNSTDAHEKNEKRKIRTLRSVLPESGSVLPPDRDALYSVRSQAR